MREKEEIEKRLYDVLCDIIENSEYDIDSAEVSEYKLIEVRCLLFALGAWEYNND